MKLEEIHTHWSTDSVIDWSNPPEMMRRVPLLHAKYWRIWTEERERFLAAKREYDTLRLARLNYWCGRIDEAERKARGWEPQPLRIVRTESDEYLNGDEVLKVPHGKMERQHTKLKLLEGIVKNINERGFLVRSYVDYLRFSQGQ